MTQDYIRSILHYNPETGVFCFKAREDRRPCWNSRHAGKPTGTKNSRGYIVIRVDDKLYLAHRLAFLYMKGFMPKTIDHADGDPSNNKFSNLRACTTSENLANTRLRKDNKTGYKGVFYLKRLNKWKAYIRKYGKSKTIGYYDNPEEAAAAYKKEACRLYGDFARC